MKKDYLIILAVYSLLVMLISVIIPINTKWAYCAFILVVLAFVLQWYCNRQDKSIPKPLPMDMRWHVILQEAEFKNIVFRCERCYTKEPYESIINPDIQIVLKEQMVNDLAKYILTKNEDSFVTKYHSERNTTTIEIELVILTKEQFKQIIKNIDNP